MRYPYVLLDVGETLIGPRESFGAVYSVVHRELGIDLSPETWERAIRGVWADVSSQIRPGTDRYAQFEGGEEAYWLQFVTRAQESATGRPAIDGLPARALSRLREAFAVASAWKLYPEVIPALRELREDGARLGVVSNWDSRLPGILELLELRPYFDVVGVSHLEGVEKPDPAFFRLVLERLGGSPERTVHVGDVPELDVVGARAAGIDALLVDRHARNPAGIARIDDLSALPAIARREVPLAVTR